MPKQSSETLLKIVNILNDCQYHDGNRMGEQLGISRTAVWKMIKKLEESDIAIDSAKGKGYCLKEPLYLLDANLIQKQLPQKNLSLDVFESIDSTNQYIKQTKANSKIQVCIAEEQTQGRGRLNRSWHSPYGKNIYLSLAYRFQKDISELSCLSLVVSVAIQKVLSDLALPLQPLIKWPNDIYYQDKKISGNLIEIQAESNGYTTTIIGIGINANMSESDANDIDQAWTSLQLILGKPIDRNQLCIHLINHLTDTLDSFVQYGEQAFVEKWKQLDYLKEHPVSLIAFEKEVKGIARGVDDRGHLLIEDSDGHIKAYASGDASRLRRV